MLPFYGPHKRGYNRRNYAFITTEPNEIVGAIHAKAMPVILTRDKWMDWLHPPADIAKMMVKTHDNEEMEETSMLSD